MDPEKAKQLERLIQSEVDRAPDLAAPADLVGRVLGRIQTEQRLERTVGSVLDGCGELEAPPSLIPRVLAEVALRESRAWWLRPWFEWPTGVRIVSGLFAAGVGVGLVALLSRVALLSSFKVPSGLLQFWQSLSGLWGGVQGIGRAVGILVDQVQPWVLACGFGGFLMLTATCVGLGAAFVRLADHLRVSSAEL